MIDLLDRIIEHEVTLSKLRNVICGVFGHNYICLHRDERKYDGITQYTITGWKCQRCGKLEHEQWDS